MSKSVPIKGCSPPGGFLNWPMGGEHEPTARRPVMFGSVIEPVLPWSWALERLTMARHYWIATTRENGRPHTRPVWGIVIDGSVFFSTGSLAAVNLAASPEVSVHTESATELVILVCRASAGVETDGGTQLGM